MKIRIGSTEREHEFWVADIENECIIGLDFLTTYNCMVDVAGASLRIGSEEVQLRRVGAASKPQCRRVVCIGNSIISSAITDKQARVSFKKLQNSASPKDERYLRFLKTHECLFSVIAREIILLLINNIKRKC